MSYPIFDLDTPTIGGPMASNAIAGQGNYPNTADINFGPPAGGVNASSMIAGARRGLFNAIGSGLKTMVTPSAYNTDKAMPRLGYALGRAAQAIMGPYQSSPAALLGGVGAELSQQEAQRRTAARLLAGENLEDIKEASVLSPQQQQIVLRQAAERRKQKFDEATMETKLRFEAKKLGMDERATDAYVQEKLASLGLIKKQTEGYESPAAARAAQAEVESRLIRERGDQQVRVAEVERDGAMSRLKQGHTWAQEEKGEIGKQFTDLFLGILGTREVEPKDATNLTMGLMNKLSELKGGQPLFEIEEPAATPTTEGAPKKVYRTQKEYDKRDAVEPKPEKPAASWTDKLGPNTTAYYPVAKDSRPDWLINVEDHGYGTKNKPVLIINPKPEQLKWLKDGTYIANKNGQVFIVRGGQLYASE